MEIKKGQVWYNIHNNHKVTIDKVEDDFVYLVGGYVTDALSFIDNWRIKGDLVCDYKPQQYNLGIDTFKRCESNMTRDEILVCCKFNIDKYNWRTKGQDKEDLEKIINYAKWALEQF